MTQRTIVPPPILPLTVEDARELLAPCLLKLCSEHGPKKVATAIGGADDKTVRDARDEKSTLGLHYVANLLPLDGTALDPFLKRVGRRSVPDGAVCDTDAGDRACESKVLRAALALSVALADDQRITPDEVRDNRETIEDAIEALTGLLGKLRAPSLRSVR